MSVRGVRTGHRHRGPGRHGEVMKARVCRTSQHGTLVYGSPNSQRGVLYGRGVHNCTLHRAQDTPRSGPRL